MSGRAIVAQAPSRSHNPDKDWPLQGRCGDRLARLAGLGSFEELACVFTIANLQGVWRGKDGKGDRFERAPAREAAARVARVLAEDEVGRVLLLGRHVGEAFGLAGAPYLRWLEPTEDAWMPAASMGPLRADCYARGLWLVPGRMRPHVWPDALYALFPHPSGISHWWNDARNERAARRFMRELVADAHSVC